MVHNDVDCDILTLKEIKDILINEFRNVNGKNRQGHTAILVSGNFFVKRAMLIAIQNILIVFGIILGFKAVLFPKLSLSLLRLCFAFTDKLNMYKIIKDGN